MSFAAVPSDAHEPISTINITPLIDVMLALLLIFMLTAPLMVKRLPLPLRGDGVPQTVEPRLAELAIHDGGALVLDGVRLSRDQLDDQLHLLAATAPTTLRVSPQAHSRYDDLAHVLAAAQNAGLGAIQIAGTTD